MGLSCPARPPRQAGTTRKKYYPVGLNVAAPSFQFRLSLERCHSGGSWRHHQQVMGQGAHQGQEAQDEEEPGRLDPDQRVLEGRVVLEVVVIIYIDIQTNVFQ